MANRISRREFLEQTALAGAAAGAVLETPARAATLPTRALGKTGERVTILALGCGSRLLSYEKEDKAVEALNFALDHGIRYLDSAYGYGNGRSETWVGQVMKSRRAGVFLATKINARDGDEAKRILEGSLKRLQTDHVDLIHVHSLTDEADLAKIEAKGGVLDVLYRLREQKVTHFIGITSHTDPTVLRTALERHDFDCTQMALNAALQGMASGKGKMVLNPEMKPSFERVALPVALQKNLGILGMKAMGQEDLVGAPPRKAEPSRLLRYTLSLPIASCVVGMPTLEMIRQNVELAGSFKPMSKSEMKKFSTEMAEANKLALDRKFLHHSDFCA